MARTDELLDELMKDYRKPEDLIGENGLLKELTKRLIERAMQAEMTDHLGYEKHAPTGRKTSNSRNGSYKKALKVNSARWILPFPETGNRPLNL